jgi:glycosyltransferase involved in cell wall biosynthesis
MELSVIISTYNNAVSLERTLRSLAQQDADKAQWECVVVNNASTDNTQSVVEKLIEELDINIRLVTESQQGLSYARNKGIAESQGNFLVFIDDDETINKEFVSAYIDLYLNHGAFAAGGKVVACYDGRRPKWMSKYTEKMIANPIDLGRSVTIFPSDVMPAGGNMGFNREIFTLYKGFDVDLGRKGKELLGGEENDIFNRIRSLGERVFYTPHAIVYHHISEQKLTEEYFDKLSYGVGKSKRVRAEKAGEMSILYSDEKSKQFYTYILAILYTLILQPRKAKWLLRMRRGISKGVFDWM